MSAQPDPASLPEDVQFIEAVDVKDQPEDQADQSPYADGEDSE